MNRYLVSAVVVFCGIGASWFLLHAEDSCVGKNGRPPMKAKGEVAEEMTLREWNKNSYDYVVEDSYQDKKPPVREKPKEGVETVVYDTSIGKVKVEVEQKKTDFASQCKADWDKRESSRSKKDEKREPRDPAASFSIHWSNRDDDHE